MNKFVPFEKLSKAKKKEFNNRRRSTWGELNPVTRKPQNPKAYTRKKSRDRSEAYSGGQGTFNLYENNAGIPGVVFFFHYSSVTSGTARVRAPGITSTVKLFS